MENYKKIMYLSKGEQEKLNEYEKEHKKISYRTLLDRLNINCILCNNIINIDELLYNNIVSGSVYDEEDDTYKEIYQYYIIDASDDDIKYINNWYKDELIISYSEKLENYILLVDHFGTSWDYVLTDITYNDNFEKVLKIHEEQEKRANNER